MPTKARLNSVAPVLRVADLQRSLAYYRDCLGFRLEFEYDGFYASVIRDGCGVHLKCAVAPRRDQSEFETEEHIDANFAVTDIESFAAEFVKSGAFISTPLRQMPYGKELYVRDPDGYFLGFVEPGDPE